jgi:hypothetical protein
MNTVQMSGSDSPADAVPSIEIDEYVPLRFRTYRKAIGAGYIRLGNYQTTLTELIAHPASRTLRGVTLSFFKSYVDWPRIGATAPTEGLPVLRADWGSGNRIDITRDFSVSLRENELLVAWDELSDLSSSLVFGNAQFLITGSELRGIRFFNLSDQDVRALGSYGSR